MKHCWPACLNIFFCYNYGLPLKFIPISAMVFFIPYPVLLTLWLRTSGKMYVYKYITSGNLRKLLVQINTINHFCIRTEVSQYTFLKLTSMANSNNHLEK